MSRNLTQKALAELVGTGQKTVSRIEGGHPGTKLDTLFRIIAALDLDLKFEPRSKVVGGCGEQGLESRGS